jgi:signal transduction histidine kinase
VHFFDDLLAPTLDMLQPQISAKEMHVKMPPEAESGSITCDPDLLKIVLMNLVGNAAKYGNAYGEIRIGLQEDEGQWTISVENDGPGFPESSIPKLFRKFSRLNIPELHRESGTGIGLYNAWRIIAHHGGKIWAESKQGEWAKFSFSVPKAVSEQ